MQETPIAEALPHHQWASVPAPLPMVIPMAQSLSYVPCDPFWPLDGPFPDRLLRQVYLHSLLGLPRMYFSRVTFVFVETGMTISQIKEMAIEASDPEVVKSGVHHVQNSKLERAWESLVTALISEWEMTNLVCTIFLPTMITILQMPCAAADPVVRYAALFCLLFSFLGLVYGVILTVRFEVMKRPYRAVEWAIEGQLKESSILWNPWIMLALPAISLLWATILFVVFMMALLWHTSSGACADVSFHPVLPATELKLRLAFSAVLMLGAIYLALILITLSGSGDPLKDHWKWKHPWKKAHLPPSTTTPRHPPMTIPLGSEVSTARVHSQNRSPSSSHLPQVSTLAGLEDLSQSSSSSSTTYGSMDFDRRRL